MISAVLRLRVLLSTPTLIRNRCNFHSLIGYSARNGNKPLPFYAACNIKLFQCREFSGRAGKVVKPGVALVIDGQPHKVKKITQGKRGKGGGYVR
jgi:hypothetical protein